MIKPNTPPKMTRMSFNLTEDERILLINYCEQKGRNMTEILRELIRNLKPKQKIDKRD